MKVRLIENLKNEHPIFSEWWRVHGHPEIPIEALPNPGIVVESDDSIPLPLAVGFLYECNSASVAWLEWITTNPTISPFTARRSVGLLVEFMVLEAARNGYVILMSSCRQKSLGRVLQEKGFVLTDDKISHFLRITNKV